ncbi:MAG TPA: PAS domain-containing protein, partial [Firmicutes bacterium]|nr:PAS domain-containing protein [Bacillota bacterium]
MHFDSREDFFLHLFVDYTLINEMLMNRFADVILQKLGIKYGQSLEENYREETAAGNNKFTVDELVAFLLHLLHRLGGSYLCKHRTETKLEFVCYDCPFRHMILKSPALCKVIQGIIGSIVVQNFSYCKIEVRNSQSRKDPYCHFIIFLKQTDEARQSPGEEFTDTRTSYFITRKEMLSAKADLFPPSQVYDPAALQGFEDLKSIYREMKMEYNQLRDEIFSDLKMGVVTVNNANQITYLNKAAQELLLGEDGESLQCEPFLDILGQTLSTSKRFNQYLLQVQLTEGQRFYSVNTSPLYDEGGIISGAVGVFQDVTERKYLENELLQMEKFSLVAELAAGTAHEIRNPMTTLRGFLQVLSREFRPGTKGYEYCELMIDEIDRANSIIKEFLLLTKPAAPNLEETDIHTILEEISLLIESKSLLENVELQKQFAASLPPVKADPAQIKQVFLNIATNAIQAMPAGGRLTISGQAKEGKVVIAFADTGCGMEEAQ